MWSGRDEQTCLSWLRFSWEKSPLGAAPLLCLTVTADGKSDDSDLPELRSIQLGYESCVFKEDVNERSSVSELMDVSVFLQSDE